MHARRRQVLLAAVAALLQHPQLSISALGRALKSGAKPKHRIKRIDRLIGNPHLM
ncbi:MAG TPA: IS4 family transposase, partial [Gammaproteobacteria bacterium]|nr:IS4 family transposase [Gammaproteobacteria bacterium]